VIFLASGFWDKRVKIINMLMQYEAHTSNTPHSLRSVECVAMWCSLSLSQSLHHSLIYSNQTCKSFHTNLDSRCGSSRDMWRNSP
jgi:hypothetical protein